MKMLGKKLPQMTRDAQEVLMICW